MNLLNLFRRPSVTKPIIMTDFGPVSESARLQAASNMRGDDELKHRVEQVLAKELGSAAKGIMESRRRYPEAYVDDTIPNQGDSSQ